MNPSMESIHGAIRPCDNPCHPWTLEAERREGSEQHSEASEGETQENSTASKVPSKKLTVCHSVPRGHKKYKKHIKTCMCGRQRPDVATLVNV